MRTSASQYEILVSFMERHGDLSKPFDGPHGRMSNMTLWTDLVNLLNADAVGETKAEDKWRKTWSDLKNNTKRKAARINKAVSGTGGGPASRVKLTDIEERVLAIIHPQSATGMIEIDELGLQDVQQDADPQMEQLVNSGDTTSLETSSRNIPTSTDQTTPDQSGLIRGPTPPATPASTPVPAAAPTRASPRRHNRRRNIMGLSPRSRPGTSSQSELARQTFVNTDREWREFRIAKEKRDYEIEKERLRLREIELQQQAKWQELFSHFLLVLEKISDNFKNKLKNR